ncbi:hypothetical protein Acr_00g0076420 [Actinidia rufa]|uniref:SET domain-containing protein n=1 Tax=Actinidia rufa TaxID=165716 RepID=A0A7J0DUA4_9ERIC|nr:hypothetical protein Acr_00g0076420 [Actinidia rufa]
MSLYQTEHQLTQDAIGVSRQVILKGARLVKLFVTVGAHARYPKKSDWNLHRLECGVLSKLDKDRQKSLTPSIRLMMKLYLRRKLQSEKLIPITVTDNYNLVGALVSRILAYINPFKLACNAHTICDSELRPLGTGLCFPNSVLVFEGRVAVIRAVQRIPKGTEVFISYIETAGSTTTRQKALREQYFFSCACPRCIKEGNSDDIQESAILEGYRCKDGGCNGFLLRDSGDKGFICQQCGIVRDKEEIKKLVGEINLLSEKASKLVSSGCIL